MGEVASSQLLYIFLFLAVPFITGLLFKRVGLPLIIGYITGGIIIANLPVPVLTSEAVETFASFGVMLLMFTLGLEINFERIIRLKKIIIFGGILQIVLSSLFIFLIGLLFGFDFIQSFLIGIALSSSSTALVAKLIQERAEESTFLGGLAIGILMFQDVSFIPFIIIFTFFQGNTQSYSELFKSVLIGTFQSIFLITVMYYVGCKVMPYIFDGIVKTSRELLNLFIVTLIILIAFGSSLLGVPMLISMFIAGVVVSQTLEHYHIFSQIRPLRDLLSIVFFIYIGTHIQIGGAVHMLPGILAFTALIVLAKAAILLIIFVYFRLHSRVAFGLSLLLFQISENAFILLTLAYTKGVYSNDQLLFLLTSVLLSLIATPLLINGKDGLYRAARNLFRRYMPSVELFVKYRVDRSLPQMNDVLMKRHVVICGYGRIGMSIGRALQLANIPFIAIDYNLYVVERARREGVDIIYGDPTDPEILDALDVDTAQAIVLTVPEASQETLLFNSRKLNPKIVTIATVHNADYIQRMKDLGADVVAHAELEASLSVIKKLFVLKNMEKQDIVNKIKHFKTEQGLLS